MLLARRRVIPNEGRNSPARGYPMDRRRYFGAAEHRSVTRPGKRNPVAL